MSTAIIVEQIEKRAKEAGLSIAEVCRKASVANSTFTRWKSGDTNPNYAKLVAIQGVLEQAEARQ